MNPNRWGAIHVRHVTLMDGLNLPSGSVTEVTYRHRRSGRVKRVELSGKWPLAAFAEQSR